MMAWSMLLASIIMPIFRQGVFCPFYCRRDAPFFCAKRERDFAIGEYIL